MLSRCLLSVAGFFYRQGRTATNECQAFEHGIRTGVFTESNFRYFENRGTLCGAIGAGTGGGVAMAVSTSSLGLVYIAAAAGGFVVAPVVTYGVSRGMCGLFSHCPHRIEDEPPVLLQEEAPIPMEMPGSSSSGG